ncbi:MAG: hypothetical protein WED07_06485 [Candidatus Freyarchaeum deiterrae]
MNDATEILIERIKNVLEELSVPSEGSHPRFTVFVLGSNLTSIMNNFRCLDLLNSILLIQYVGKLFDEYFDRKIDILSKEELNKTSIPQEIKNMISREFGTLSFDDCFGPDYILNFSAIKANMTVINVLEEVFRGEEYGKLIFGCISKAADKILEEINEICSELLQTLLNEVREKKTIKSLEETIKELVRNLHIKVKGWA